MRASLLVVLSTVLMAGVLPAIGSAAEVPGVDDDVDCDDETEIAMAVSGGEVVQTKNVSTAWYQNKEYVREVREDFDEEYPRDETEWLTSTGITSIDEPVCDMNQMAISLGVTDEQIASDELGDTYEEVPLVIEERGSGTVLGASADDATDSEDDAPVTDSHDTTGDDTTENDTIEEDKSTDGDDETPVTDSEGSTEGDATEEDEVPGFGFTAALGCLVVAVIVARRRTSR